MASVRTAFVAASTSGLGLECAKTLARRGTRVAITGRRGDLARELASQLPGCVGIEVDLTNQAALNAAADDAVSQLGPIDILVLNSGGPPRLSARDTGPDELEAAMSLVLYPAAFLLKTFVTSMCERRWGRVIAIGSSGVEQPIPQLATSNASRAALAALLKTLSSEVARDGVTVNMILPGRYATDRAQQLDLNRATQLGTSAEDVARSRQEEIPVGRYGTPNEFAAVAAFLASEEASYVTGALVRADGGLITTIT